MTTYKYGNARFLFHIERDLKLTTWILKVSPKLSKGVLLDITTLIELLCNKFVDVLVNANNRQTQTIRNKDREKIQRK